MFKCAVILLAALVAVQARPNFKLGAYSFDNCGLDTPLQLTSLTISPDPIPVPGTVTFSTEIVGTVGVNDPTPGDFTVSHLNPTTGAWDDVPCFGDKIKFGSCSYDNVCDILTALYDPTLPCPEAYDDEICHCPFPAGDTTVTNAQVVIENSFPNLDNGTYSVNLILYADATKADIIGCINIQADLQHV